MRYREGLVKLFRENFRLKRGERVLVFADLPDAGVPAWVRQHRCAREAAEVAAEQGADATLVEYAATGTHGAEPPAGLWAQFFGEEPVRRLERSGVLARILAKRASARDLAAAARVLRAGKAAAPQVVVGLSRYSTTHTRFRSFATSLARARYASMPIFDPLMFAGRWPWTGGSLAPDARLRRGAQPRGPRRGARRQRHVPAHGPRRPGLPPDDGLLHAPGTYGNLPAGEAFLAPLEGTTQGVLVAEWSQTDRLRKPMALWVRDGLLHEVEGEGPAADLLRRKVRESALNANVAELGVGTNPGARRPDNILESEKILGTIHVAFGDNHGFGGKVATPFHQDYVVFRASLVAKLPGGRAKEILRDGKWVL